MNYEIALQEFDLDIVGAARIEDESDEDYEARLEFQKGKSLFRITILDSQTKMLSLESPLFETKDNEKRLRMAALAMTRATKVITDRERKKKAAPAEKKSPLILPPGFGTN